METQEKEAEKIIKETAGECGVEAVFVTKQQIEEMSKLQLKLLGVHQWENAAVAKLASEHVLTKLGVNYDEEKIKKSLQDTLWPGRMEVLSEKPFFMVDGAHNGHGVSALRKSLEILYPSEKFHMIMAVMADKDYKDMVRELLPLAKDFVTVTADSNRALQAKELAEFINENGVVASCVESVNEALETLSTDIKNLAFGSLYFIGEIKEKY